MQPLISVIIPVYNGAAYLAESIESILGQSFKDFEIIVINDGSRDQSEDVAKRFLGDSRVKYFSQENIGLAKTLNKAIELSSGVFIARQDQDDISFPDRLEKQVQLFKQTPDLGLIGGGAQIVDMDGRPTGRTHFGMEDDQRVKAFLLFDNPLFHSSVMFKKELFESIGGYSWLPERQPEDYDLWSRMALATKISAIAEPVIKYRETPGSMSRVSAEPFPQMYNITKAYSAAFLGLNMQDSQQWALWVHKKVKHINPLILVKVVLCLLMKNRKPPSFFWRRLLSLIYRGFVDV